MTEITFKRTGPENTDGGVPGELKIGDSAWPTIERGEGYSFARKGEFTLQMDVKNSNRRVECLRLNHPGIRAHLIHDAMNDDHHNLTGCMAPGITTSTEGICGSAEAMRQIFDALGGFTQGKEVKILIENNIVGDETGEQWIQRRLASGKY